jgi:hypothetical protein
MAAQPAAEHSRIASTVTAPGGLLPVLVHHAGRQTMDAYRAAQQAPDVLAAVPCTCGCAASLGHRNNLDCYVDELHRGGEVSYSTHGFDCYICQVITRDAIAGAAKGMTNEQLRRMILDTYSLGK